MQVLFSCGEASGDVYVAELATRLKALDPSMELTAVGGRRSLGAGCAILCDSTRWGVMGILQAFLVYPKVLAGLYKSKSFLARVEPGLFVPVDYGYLNIRLARFAKSKGWKVAYFSPPGSWRKDRQGADLPGITDLIVTPFSWSAEILGKMGADARWYGHPLNQIIAGTPKVAERSGIAVLPGSRKHEVDMNLRPVIAAIKPLGLVARIGVAPSIDEAWLRKTWDELGGPPAEFFTTARDALSGAQVAIVCSGTATLEAALCNTPTVIVYRVTPAMYVEFYIRRPVFKFIGLPNILLDRLVVPELIHTGATPESIREHVVALLADGPERRAQLDAFAELAGTLGPDDALDRSAQAIFELAKGHGPNS